MTGDGPRIAQISNRKADPSCETPIDSIFIICHGFHNQLASPVYEEEEEEEDPEVVNKGSC